ncbi:MAG: ATP synthase F1 subunit gamma [Chloroflexota bacterium]
MPSLRQIRQRIRSVKGTAQMTRAMELVSASKMRRAQSAVLAARPYADKIQEVIAHLAGQSSQAGEGALHPLLSRRPSVGRVGVILITSDRGLAGGLNANILRTATNHLLAQEAPAVVTVMGRKGRDWVLRYGRQMRAEFVGLNDRPSYMEIAPVARGVVDDYCSGYVDRVDLIYTRFVSTLNQRPIVQTLLPITPTENEAAQTVDYIYEPSAAGVLAELLPRYVEVEIYRALLEAVASEHSARMVAMRSATDNANDIIRDLSLVYNQARQAAITSELIDIVGGVRSGAE